MELVIRTIIESAGDFSHVVVSRDVFTATKGFKPELPYTTSRNSTGQGIRIFEFDDAKLLYVRYDKEEQKTVFIADNETAQACLLTLDEERADEPVLAMAY